MLGDQRLIIPPRQQVMRHAVRRLRRLDEELADPPDEIPLSVIGLRSHQFRSVQFHRLSPLGRSGHPPYRIRPVRTCRATKNPRTGETLAAGKCLTNMDLPLAASEPSPPDRPSHGLQLARDPMVTQTAHALWVPLQPLPTRARFDFAPRTHRERIHSVVFDPTNFWGLT